jgi:hypothetical protein
MKKRIIIAATAAAVLASFGAAPQPGTVVPVIDGHIWRNSSQAEKRAYLVGVANTLALGQAVAAKERGADPSTALSRMNQKVNLETIDEGIRDIDAWYRANPSRIDLPVLGVIVMETKKP